ncbi:Kunitz/Bovine pancreatic trypsin inhibitor domain protein [Ancylostoma caninum]|uniref:Kunitz/Bovine pancreatic trypsin inhibitor domain protein n=1 Tax=Ancylostoma caninum TaxID=29170 RepID=A0A368GN01_ANCCA|nr:Kunitz/Bovine pancreatic trypsin inhibitor domain protein [Ancylostoma caninum]
MFHIVFFRFGRHVSSVNNAYGYDKSKKKCVEFFYNGSGGNHNRFKYKHECIKTCIAKYGDDESRWSDGSIDVGKPKLEDTKETRKHITITDATRGKHQKSKEKGDRNRPSNKKKIEDSRNNGKDKKKKEHRYRPCRKKEIGNSKNNGKDKKKRKGHKGRPCKKKKMLDSKNNGKNRKKRENKDRLSNTNEIEDSKNNREEKKERKEHKDRPSNRKEIEESINNENKKKRKENKNKAREGVPQPRTTQHLGHVATNTS